MRILLKQDCSLSEIFFYFESVVFFHYPIVFQGIIIPNIGGERRISVISRDLHQCACVANHVQFGGQASHSNHSQLSLSALAVIGYFTSDVIWGCFSGSFENSLIFLWWIVKWGTVADCSLSLSIPLEWATSYLASYLARDIYWTQFVVQEKETTGDYKRLQERLRKTSTLSAKLTCGEVASKYYS